MYADNFTLQGYFQRIAYGGEARADLVTATALMGHHLQAIPFENPDIRAGME
ncbi:MAG TPA: hypothetical protein PKH69_01105 [Thiobacillaceae bacterium]|nr:hypothetical protein [Thiobacillaceae bacterium]HNU63286.1 hypothetical protein [Thiobacillaceae bacterium]